MADFKFKCQYCPCLMRYLDHDDWNVILVGSYELTDQVRPCGRSQILGDLIVLRDGRLLAKEENENGGVFDFALLAEQSNQSEQSESALLVYTAHANGSFAMYQLNRSDPDEFEFKQRFSVQTESNMFTSIHIHPIDSNDVFSLLGDDSGHVYSFRNDQQIGRFAFPGLDQPCWCLHFEPLASASTSGFVMIGSDDSKLRVVAVNSDYELNPDQTKVLSKFEAGVTSICRLKRTSEVALNEVIYLIGSYDEHVYEFRATLPKATDTLTSAEMIMPTFRYEQRVHVQGSGVWKIAQLFQTDDVDQVCLLSSMYAGTHLLQRSRLIGEAGDEQQSTEVDRGRLAAYRLHTIQLPDRDQASDRLVYASALNRSTRSVCFASFYERLVQQVSLPDRPTTSWVWL
jgi:hypothetical protein